MIFHEKRLYVILLVVVALLAIPAIAMQFTREVNWSGFDFAIMGALLSVTGLTIDLVLRKVQARDKRFLLIGIVLVVVLLIWAELAVGIFGTPFAGT